ncbi:MAG: transposase [bacterium]
MTNGRTFFIAAITQHIPDKFSQLVRYYGFYSNKSRGLCAKAEQADYTPVSVDENSKKGVNIIDISQYQSENVRH